MQKQDADGFPSTTPRAQEKKREELLGAGAYSVNEPAEPAVTDLNKHAERVSVNKAPLNATNGALKTRNDTGAVKFVQPKI